MIPSVESVASHHDMHKLSDAKGRDFGGVWLVIDPTQNVPVLIRLKVKNGEIVMQNGILFWQPLAECSWAERSEFISCTPRGFPVGHGYESPNAACTE